MTNDELESEGPQREISYGLDEALELLAALEDARDSLILTGQLVLVLVIEAAIQQLSRKLRLGNEGDPDDE